MKALFFFPLLVIFFFLGFFHNIKFCHSEEQRDEESRQIGILRFTQNDAKICDRKNCIHVETASSMEEMRHGLMQRDFLLSGHGMFFIFERDDLHAFWMKNMKFPIDIIWVSKDGLIQTILPKVQPCRKEPCAIYMPQVPVRYVLEVNAGVAKQLKWQKGTRLHTKDMNKLF